MYPEGETPNGDELSIRLNICANEWGGNIRDVDCFDRGKSTSNILYDEGQVIVVLKDKRLIYRDISKHITHKISKKGIVIYIREENTH